MHEKLKDFNGISSGAILPLAPKLKMIRDVLSPINFKPSNAHPRSLCHKSYFI
jgi:hypothetical protein